MWITAILILINSLVWGCILATNPIEVSPEGYLFSFCVGLVIGIIVIPGYFMVIFAGMVETIKFMRSNIRI